MVSVHGAKHIWASLRLVCDVAELIGAHPEMDWDAVIDRAGALRAGRMLSLALFLASDLLGAVLPEDVSRRVQADSTIPALAADVQQRLFADGRPPPDAFPVIEPFHLKLLESRWDRYRYCLQIVTTPTVEDWELLPLPAALFPLYYVERPLRLAGKYCCRVWRR
jgi:hypothetical protein